MESARWKGEHEIYTSNPPKSGKIGFCAIAAGLAQQPRNAQHGQNYGKQRSEKEICLKAVLQRMGLECAVRYGPKEGGSIYLYIYISRLKSGNK